MWLQHFLFPSILQFCCLLCASVLFYQYCFTISAYALRIADSQPPNHLSFPVYHYKSFALSNDTDDAHKRHSRSMLNPSDPAGNSVSSNVVTLAQNFGQFFAELQIGTPATDIAVILDTGSDPMWIQCMPCARCGQQAEGFSIFDPEQSSTYQNLMCDAPMCLQGNVTVQTGCTDLQECYYNMSYADKSNSFGSLALETLTFTSSSFTWTQFVFGCGYDNVGVETQFKASGLMGLDRGPYSIISQLGVDVFSYCLPNRANNVDVSGYLTFGAGASNGMSSLQYTPMIQNIFSPFLSQFYYLSLSGGVSVNGILLDIPAAAFEIDIETGSGGTFIDSGTTLTTFVDEAYTVITQAFDNYMGASYRKVDLGISFMKLCYEVPLLEQRGPPEAPKVTLHFAGSVDMELGTDQLFYLYSYDTTNNYYCLAITSGGTLASGARNIIGNYQQQDFLVEYDIVNSRVGFSPTQCSTTNNAPTNYSP